MRWAIRRLGKDARLGQTLERRVIEALLSVAALVVWQSTIKAAQLDCLVVPQRTADVAFATSGVVEEILVDRGDRVKKG